MICKRFSFGIFVFVAAVAGGVTIHRSFATRDVGFGGGASVSVPVDSRVAMAVYEADEREANRTKVYVGRVTRVSDGDTIWILTTGGNTKVKVRLDRIDAPESDQPFGKESAAYLKQLIGGREVRIEYQKRDQYGRVLGIVYLAKEDVNLKMVAEGMAWHYSHFDKTPAYAAAEVAARQAKKGLWAAENPINPYRWRKGDRTAKAPPAVSKFAAGNDPTNDSAALPSVRKEYFAGRNPNVAARPACPVSDDFPESGYWLSTNSDKRHNKSCPNYRKTRGYPCRKNEGTPCKKCGG